MARRCVGSLGPRGVSGRVAGMSDGLDMGCNGRAGIITRGLTEMSRITLAKGGNPMPAAPLPPLGNKQ